MIHVTDKIETQIHKVIYKKPDIRNAFPMITLQVQWYMEISMWHINQKVKNDSRK